MRALPPRVDLRERFHSPYDQGDLGSCTAQSVCGSIQFTRQSASIPSRLFVYYNTRVLEGTTSYDSGASIRNTVKAVARHGHCGEPLWPYDIAKFRRKPSGKAYVAAEPNRITRYERIPQKLNALKSVLADGRPIPFGFAVYDSFESDEVYETGMMPMPLLSERIQGGHAVLAVGYDDDQQRFIIRNSWGIEWGDKGYFYMPYLFIENSDYCSDFWVIR